MTKIFLIVLLMTVVTATGDSPVFDLAREMRALQVEGERAIVAELKKEAEEERTPAFYGQQGIYIVVQFQTNAFYTTNFYTNAAVSNVVVFYQIGANR